MILIVSRVSDLLQNKFTSAGICHSLLRRGREMITKEGESEIPNGHLAAVAARLRLSSAEWGLLARMPQPDMVWADMDSSNAFDPRNSFAEHFSFQS